MERGVRHVLTRRLIFFGCVVGMGVALLGLSGCVLFNKLPIAGFTIGPSTTGPAPFTVTLSGAPSTDPDGEIETYTWDFGDGAAGTGKTVPHTYTTVGTFTIILTVTDQWGGTDQAAKTVYVTAPEPAGPSASFTVNPTSGTSPVNVTVDASASTYPGGTITAYEWTFGDGGTGFGVVTSHTYFSGTSRTYTITLLIRASDGKTGTATKTVTVAAPGGGGGTPVAGAPSAQFDIDEAVGVGPFQVRFDPTDSEADEGRTIILYTWSFGDGDATSTVNPSEQVHVYVTDSPSEVFTVTLLVLDNEGGSDSMSKTVKIYNHRPVAGFDIANPPGGDLNDAGAVEYTTPALAFAADEWVEDDVVYGDMFNNNGVGGAFPVTITVCIRSRALETAWYDITDTGDQTTLTQANGTLATSSSVPGAPNDRLGNDYDDHNFSYDPEAQAWDGAPPAWFTAPTDYGEGWGIRYLRINWGDGTTEDRIEYAEDDWSAFLGDVIAAHDYSVTVDGTVRTITVTAEDWLGQRSASFSRQVTLKVGYESNPDEI